MRRVEMIPRENIGLFGGSFDPVHHGHLIMAREAMETLGLSRVVFIPANISPHKLGRPPAPAGVQDGSREGGRVVRSLAQRTAGPVAGLQGVQQAAGRLLFG